MARRRRPRRPARRNPVSDTTLLWIVGGVAVLGVGTAIYFATRKPPVVRLPQSGGGYTSSSNPTSNQPKTIPITTISTMASAMSLAPVHGYYTPPAADETPKETTPPPPNPAAYTTPQDFMKDMAQYLQVLKSIGETWKVVQQIYGVVKDAFSQVFKFSLPALDPVSFGFIF